jgi:hypothetical protein
MIISPGRQLLSLIQKFRENIDYHPNQPDDAAEEVLQPSIYVP